MAPSSFRYQSAPKNDEEKLRLALIKLGKKYGRYGYRKITALLRMEGWDVNHKTVERIWREEGLQLPKRHKKRKRLYHEDSSVIRPRPLYQNHIWSVDFVHDKLSSARPYKMLTALVEYTLQALWVEVKPRMGSADVLEALNKLLPDTESRSISDPIMGPSSLQPLSSFDYAKSASSRYKYILGRLGVRRGD